MSTSLGMDMKMPLFVNYKLRAPLGMKKKYIDDDPQLTSDFKNVSILALLQTLGWRQKRQLSVCKDWLQLEWDREETRKKTSHGSYTIPFWKLVFPTIS